VLRSLSTQKFRGLGEFTMDGLGRVNLLVGSNNCGKTSVLEAMHLLLSTGDPWSLWTMLDRRGEDIQTSRGQRAREMDVSHLFEGHEIDLGSTFSVTGRNDGESLSLTAKIVQMPGDIKVSPEGQLPLAGVEPPDSMPVRPGSLALTLHWSNDKLTLLPLTQAGGFAPDRLPPRLRRSTRDREDVRPVELITTGALSEDDTVSALEEVVLTENEDLLIRALQSIDGGIERIAPVGRRRYVDPGGRGGVAVKLSGVKTRIPLGSMGDGMWRMLGIALSVVRAKGGVLLIDEIDTGLHYTVMEEMWRLVHDAARQLNVQVFAATHSRDCYQSLAAIVRAETGPRPEVTIQRIERGNPHAIAFTDDEITVAAEIGAEVR
jgi:predicted ATPase